MNRIDWKDEDVYSFLEDAKAPMNPLYAEGQCRVGCIGCPLAKRKGREVEFARWPKYKQLYLNAFDRMLAERKLRGKESTWDSAEDCIPLVDGVRYSSGADQHRGLFGDDERMKVLMACEESQTVCKAVEMAEQWG